MPSLAAGADEDVLVVVGHADDFVRHHLADGENGHGKSTAPSETSFTNSAGTVPTVVMPVRQLWTRKSDSGTPGNISWICSTGHRRMRAERGQNIGQIRAEMRRRRGA
jgi:hypothetical protein